MRQEAQDFEKYENLEHAFQKKTHEITLKKTQNHIWTLAYQNKEVSTRAKPKHSTLNPKNLRFGILRFRVLGFKRSGFTDSCPMCFHVLLLCFSSMVRIRGHKVQQPVETSK